MSAGDRSSRLLALVAIFFSSYIVGIYSAARASNLVPMAPAKVNETVIPGNDTLLEADDTSLGRSGSRHPRCKCVDDSSSGHPRRMMNE